MKKGLSGLFLLLLASIAHAGTEQATVFMNTDLKKSPSYSAAMVQSLDKGERLTIVSGKGIWLKVKLTENSKVQGWVRRFDIRKDSRGKTIRKHSTDGVSRLFGGLFGGGNTTNGRNTVTSTIGIRGLDNETITSSNRKADISSMTRYRSTSKSASKSAHSAGLKAQDVSYLGEQSSGGFFNGW